MIRHKHVIVEMHMRSNPVADVLYTVDLTHKKEGWTEAEVETLRTNLVKQSVDVDHSRIIYPKEVPNGTEIEDGQETNQIKASEKSSEEAKGDTGKDYEAKGQTGNATQHGCTCGRCGSSIYNSN